MPNLHSYVGDSWQVPGHQQNREQYGFRSYQTL